MKIVNQTNGTVFWSTSGPGIGDCGTLGPNEDTYIPYQAGQTFQVNISPRDPASFQATANGSQTVTVSMKVTS